MKKVFPIILFSIQMYAHAQDKRSTDNFNVLVRKEQGDLNNDGRTDKVVVTMDTIAATVPLRLQVFFAQPDGTFKVTVSSLKIIDVQYPTEKKGQHNGKQIPYFFIENGILQMVSEATGGQAVHQFKFQNGNFELIHVSQASWDGKNTTTEINFNLVTGLRTELVKSLGSEQILKKRETMVLIRPLPKIQSFKPFEHVLY